MNIVGHQLQAPVGDDIAADPADAQAIRDLNQRFLDGWGSGNGEVYASQFTEDVDYIAFDGTHFKGRAAVASSHQQLFDTFLKGTRLEGQITGIRFLRGEVALVHATGGIVMPGHTTYRPGRLSIQTMIATKQNGAWLFTAFHNNRVQRRTALQNAIWAIATRYFKR